MTVLLQTIYRNKTYFQNADVLEDTGLATVS